MHFGLDKPRLLLQKLEIRQWIGDLSWLPGSERPGGASIGPRAARIGLPLRACGYLPECSHTAPQIGVRQIAPQFGKHRDLTNGESALRNRGLQIQEATKSAEQTFKRLKNYTCDRPAAFRPEGRPLRAATAAPTGLVKRPKPSQLEALHFLIARVRFDRDYIGAELIRLQRVSIRLRGAKQ